MSQLFRFSESLGKSNGKAWPQFLKLFLIQGVQSPRRKKRKKKKLANFALLANFFWFWCYYAHRSGDALSPVCGILFTRTRDMLQNYSLFCCPSSLSNKGDNVRCFFLVLLGASSSYSSISVSSDTRGPDTDSDILVAVRYCPTVTVLLSDIY